MLNIATATHIYAGSLDDLQRDILDTTTTLNTSFPSLPSIAGDQFVSGFIESDGPSHPKCFLQGSYFLNEGGSLVKVEDLCEGNVIQGPPLSSNFGCVVNLKLWHTTLSGINLISGVQFFELRTYAIMNVKMNS